MAYHELGRRALIQGIRQVADIIVSTMGPYGHKVALPQHGKQVLTDQMSRDGVTVARACQDILQGPIENMGTRLLVHACNKTVKAAGDGTTTTALLVREILTRDDFQQENQFCRKLKEAAGVAIEAIRNMAKDLSLEDVVSLATIAANNDPKLGRMIAELVYELGPDGYIYPVAAEGKPTSVEVKHGYQLESGPIIPQFFNAHNMYGVSIQNGVINLNNPHVLLLEEKVNEIQQMLPIIEAYRKACLRQDNQGREYYSNPLLVIAGDISEDALRMILINLLEPKQGHPIPIFVVKSPETGRERYEVLSDLSRAVGAKLFSRYDGTSVKAFKGAGDFGTCLSVEITEQTTRLLLSPAYAEKVEQRVERLRADMEKEGANKDFIQSRISKLNFGIGVVYIGGLTRAEHIYQQQVVEDAVLASQSAVREGGVPGGGYALAAAANKMLGKMQHAEGAVQCLFQALHAPSLVLLESAGMDEMNSFHEGFVRNIETMEEEPVDETKVIDSAAVAIAAIENAVSLACEVIQTGYAISYYE